MLVGLAAGGLLLFMFLRNRKTASSTSQPGVDVASPTHVPGTEMNPNVFFLPQGSLAPMQAVNRNSNVTTTQNTHSWGTPVSGTHLGKPSNINIPTWNGVPLAPPNSNELPKGSYPSGFPYVGYN